MKRILHFITLSLLLSAALTKGYSQSLSAGIKVGAINHYFHPTFKRANTPNSTTTMNYALFVDKSWGRKEQVLTSVSFDYYRNSLPKQYEVIGPVDDINNYYTLNINGSFLFLTLPKQNWKHYLGPTLSYSLIYMKWHYPIDYPSPYIVNPENPVHSFWMGIDYTGKIGINSRLSAIYTFGASAHIEAYNQFRFRGNAGIGYKF